MYFVGAEEPGLEVNHKDGNVRNNSYINLEWISHKANVQHYHNGRKAVCMGDGNFDIVYDMAQTDRKMMAACGLNNHIVSYRLR